MSKLTPVLRPDKNGKLVTRHVKTDSGADTVSPALLKQQEAKPKPQPKKKTPGKFSKMVDRLSDNPISDAIRTKKLTKQYTAELDATLKSILPESEIIRINTLGVRYAREPQHEIVTNAQYIDRYFDIINLNDLMKVIGEQTDPEMRFNDIQSIDKYLQKSVVDRKNDGYGRRNGRRLDAMDRFNQSVSWMTYHPEKVREFSGKLEKMLRVTDLELGHIPVASFDRHIRAFEEFKNFDYADSRTLQYAITDSGEQLDEVIKLLKHLTNSQYRNELYDHNHSRLSTAYSAVRRHPEHTDAFISFIDKRGLESLTMMVADEIASTNGPAALGDGFL